RGCAQQQQLEWPVFLAPQGEGRTGHLEPSAAPQGTEGPAAPGSSSAPHRDPGYGPAASPVSHRQLL
ncbi:hypothetical protein HGM15179_022317, partial [Zosterops borbonicus]